MCDSSCALVLGAGCGGEDRSAVRVTLGGRTLRLGESVVNAPR